MIALWTSLAAPAGAQVVPDSLYCGVNRPVWCALRAGNAELHPGAHEVELVLYDPAAGAVVERVRVAPDELSEGSRIDLARRFPVIWTGRQTRLLLVQLVLDGEPVEAPTVLEPLRSPRRFRDGLSARVLDAFARRDAVELTRLLGLSPRARDELRGEVAGAPVEPLLSGIRAYVLRDVVLETSEGALRVRLAPSSAPRTARRFLELVEGGFYDDTAFHRIVNADATGRPFIVQAGDPTGTGRGGCGSYADFEPSDLAHARGVLSMARRPEDPNTNGSQFFICLGREACAKLDGGYTAFARVVEGWETLDAIARTPVVPPEEEGVAVAERPLRPPVLRLARAVPHPPLALTPADAAPAPAAHASPDPDEAPVSR